MRALLAQLNPTIGDLQGNLKKILQTIEVGNKEQVNLILFPELVLTGYPPGDFLLLPHFLEEMSQALEIIRQASKNAVVIVGAARMANRKLYNSAYLFVNETVLGHQDKILLPAYDVFAERRYFEPGAESRIWKLCEKKIAVTICEDIWPHSGLLESWTYPIDPLLQIKEQRPDLLINLSASPFSLNKTNKRIKVCHQAALTLNCPILLCNQVGGNDSLIFDGHSLHMGGQGELYQIAKGFQEDYLIVDLEKQYSPISYQEQPIIALYQSLILGLRDYFYKSSFKKACVGLSGGIDSAVVVAIAVDALGKENVLGIAMPSRFSSKESLVDAFEIAKNLGIEIKQLSIEQPFQAYLDLLEPHFKERSWDVTEENIQARIRGAILMAFSNKLGYIVLSTGNKSELALGYATLYGDMCGGLAVIGDLTKRQVYDLARWINKEREIIPQSTMNKPPSAELRENQKDSDTLPDYDIVDNVVQQYLEQHCSPEQIAERFGYSLDLVKQLVKKIHCNEYKRRQSPPALRVSEKSFSIGRQFPIVQKWI